MIVTTSKTMWVINEAIQTYRDFINNPWAITGFGIAASIGYLLDSVFYSSTENLHTLNFICSGLTAFVLVYYLIVRGHDYTVLKLFTLIFWGNLIIAPLFFLITVHMNGSF